MVALLKLRNGEFILKNVGIFNKGGLFNKGVSEARCIVKRVTQDVLKRFLILTDLVSRKDSLYKN